MQCGGLRTKEILKTSQPEKPLITVITVVYNGVENLEQTILSVVNQTYDNIEYILIDGNSTDGTLDIIKKYEDKIDYWQSEPDKGIYDAMNKGIKLASGEWINFMNAGDVFYEQKTIQTFLKKINNVCADVFYGNSIARGKTKELLEEADESLKRIDRGPVFRHNAAFFSTRIHKENLFKTNRKDLGYGLDFKMIYDLYEKKYIFKKLDFIVVSYQIEGISYNIWKNNVYNYRVVRDYHYIKASILFLYRFLKYPVYLIKRRLRECNK